MATARTRIVRLGGDGVPVPPWVLSRVWHVLERHAARHGARLEATLDVLPTAASNLRFDVPGAARTWCDPASDESEASTWRVPAAPRGVTRLRMDDANGPPSKRQRRGHYAAAWS